MRADLDIDVIGVDMTADTTEPGRAAQAQKRGGFTIRRNRRVENIAIGVIALLIVSGCIVFGLNLGNAVPRVAGALGIKSQTPTDTRPPPSQTPEPSETPVPDTPTPFAPTAPVAGANQTPIALLLGLPEFTETPQPFNIPFFPEEAFARGEKHYIDGDLDLALESFRAAVDGNRDNYAAHYYMGQIYLQRKNYNQAASSFNAALRINGSYAPALLGRGQSTFGNRGNPLQDYQRAKDASPNWAEPYIQSAYYYASQRNVDQAIAQLETGRQLEPGNVIVLWNLAEQYLAAGRTEDARATLRAGLDLDATALDLYRVQTLLALVDEDYQSGLEAINIYISYRPADPEGWTLQGKVHLGMNSLADALTALNLAIDLKPVDPGPAYITRGQVNLLLGNAEQAGDDFNRGLAARFTTENLMLVGKAYYAVGDYANAVTRFTRARDSDRTSFDTNYWLGAAQVGNKDFDDALKTLNTALSTANSDLRRFDGFYMRAKAYEGLDMRDEAVLDLRDALVLYVTDRDEARQDAELILSRLGGPQVAATYTPTPPGS
jgi:tetratricopeptide (TPR) repeat protein